jgi:hypothetical protein
VSDLLVRPDEAVREDTRSSDRPEEGRSPFPLGVLAALIAAVATMLLVQLLVTVLVFGDGRSDASLGDALRVGAALWLLAQGAVLHLPDGAVSLLPLGLTAGLAVVLARCARWVARRAYPDPARRGSARRTAGVVCLAVAVPYTVVTVVIALLARSGDVRPSLPLAALGALVLAVAATAYGSVGVLAPDRLSPFRRGARVLTLTGAQPSAARVIARGAVAAAGVLLAGAALLAGILLASHLGTAADLGRETEGGIVGHSGVLLVQLALLPNVALWFVAYVVGPGFSIGADTTVHLVGGQLGEVPALPMFAGLPASLPLVAALAVVLIPVLAGLLAGRMVALRLGDGSWRRLLSTAAGTGPAAGLLVLVGVGMGSGAVLGGGLSTVGASAWRTGLAVAVEIGLLATAGAAGTRGWRSFRSSRRRPATPAPAPGSAASGSHRRASGGRGSAGSKLFTWLRPRPKVIRLPD